MMDKLISLCKRRGFIFQSSEIYGGTGSCWDYGPLGVEMKNNIKRLWWRDNVHQREDMVGLDASILMHPQVWEASGHVENFNDPLVECRSCKRRFRQDESLKKKLHCDNCKKFLGEAPMESTQNWDVCSKCQAKPVIRQQCPTCGSALSEPRNFNLMFKTFMGAAEDTASLTYLRPETAQGIFINFVNVQNAMRLKLPFGIAQIGKSFRNEITPGNFIFRTREFEQMEIEYFVKPGTDEEHFEKWVNARFNWYQKYGIKKENINLRQHGKDELAHYAKSCTDIEFKFPMGWSELEGVANRTDFDLKQHANLSGQQLSYFDEESKSHIIPYVIEPSAGADRSFLAFLVNGYHEETVKDDVRVLLSLHHEIAPIKIAVLPLLKKRQDIVDLCKKLTKELKQHFTTVYDDTASIGRLYRRQDEVGTPYCVTVDVETIEKDNKVTIRDRDSMTQIRVPADNLTATFQKLFRDRWGSVI